MLIHLLQNYIQGLLKQKKIVIVFLMNNVQKQVLIILITIYYMISIPIVLKFIMN